jgi:ppGpp synthetase/RelA/SpoT-type nucleotidyltranferase
MTRSIIRQYHEGYPTLELIAKELQRYIWELLAEQPVRVDWVSAQAKTPASFNRKAQKVTEGGDPRYSDPLGQIQDQIGARVTVLFLSDVTLIGDYLQQYFRHVERRHVIPESEWEFGYFGDHWVNMLPIDVVPDDAVESHVPEFFELQVKTLFQHAWSEAEHDLGYKPEASLESEQKRLLAYTSAQAWGADQVFDNLHASIRAEAPAH